MNRLILVTALLLAACLLPVHAADNPDATPPAILFLGAHVQDQPLGKPSKYRLRVVLPDARLQRQLTDWGFVWSADFFSTEMTMDYLKQFNAIVLVDFPIPVKHPGLEEGIKAGEALLADYVRQGGGLMLTGTNEYGMWGLEREYEEMNQFLAPFGGKVLSEQVGERSGALRLPRPQQGSPSALAWTGNLAKDPLLDGVKGLLYATDYAWSFYTHPVEVDSDWKVLIRGSDTAYSFKAIIGRKLQPDEGDGRSPGTYDSAPPILAVRDAGKGRLVLWPSIPSASYIDGYHDHWGSGLLMTERNATLPSSGERLLHNLYAWLCAPSAGTFGGYVKPPPEPEPEEPGLYAINWDKLKPDPEPIPLHLRGLVGLRSSFAEGKAKPAELIAAARKAGYDFAAFGDSLAMLTPEEYAQLTADCAAASDDTFSAYPGYTYLDASGNSWLTFGTNVTWPKDEWWHDRKHGMLASNNMIFRGCQFPPIIMVHPNLNPEKPYFQGDFKGMAVFTYDQGKLIDDATEAYRRLEGDDFGLFPAAVTYCDTVEAVAAATSLPATHVAWYERNDPLTAVRGNIAKHGDHYVFQRPVSVSSGPVIHSFQVYNFGTSDLAIPGNDRFRVYLRVTSPVGIKQVEILDGLGLWRRVAANGETDYSFQADGFHDRNHEFIARITDMQGGVAISSDRGTNDQELNMPRCTDNLNTYRSGKYIAEPVFAVRGLENYVDRSSGNFSYLPELQDQDNTKRPAVDQRLRLTSRFGFIKEDTIDYQYPLSASSNWNKTDSPELATPGEVWGGSVVTTMFAPWASGPAVYHVRVKLTARRDVVVPNVGIRAFQVPWREEATAFFVAHRGGTADLMVARPWKSSFFGSLDDAEYVLNTGLPGGSRALLPVTPGLSYRAITQFGQSGGSSTLLGTYQPPAGAQIKKGDAIEYEYYAAWGPMKGPCDNVFMEEIVKGFGLRGEPAYKVAPSQGKVTGTRYELRLEAENGGFAGKVTEAHLPFRVPVFITGLNANWPAGIWYRGTNTLQVPVWHMDQVHNRGSYVQKRKGTDQLFRFGVLDGTGLVQVDTEVGDKDVYIGNLLTADQPQVILELEDTRPGKVTFTANNPTDKPLTCTVRPAPGFELVGAWERPLTLQPGEFTRVTLP